MRINEINIQDFLGIEKFNTQLAENICVVSGPNASGKSSIQNAIRMILTGEPSRVNLKKDYGDLVRESDGVSGSTISTTTKEGTETVIIKKSGKADGLPNPANVPYSLRTVLDMHLFPGMDKKERRSFLFGLSDVKQSFEEIKETLLQRNHREAHIDELKSVLRSGFPAACSEARDRTSGARGVWKSITGETYGSEKAEGWGMALPEELDVDKYKFIKNDIEEAENSIREGQAKLDANAINQENSQEFEAGKAELVTKAQKLESANSLIEKIRQDYTTIKTELDTLEAELFESRGEKKADPLACPECGAALEVQGGALVPYTPPEGDPEREAQLEPLVKEYRKSLSDLERSIEQASSEQREAVEAQNTLRTIGGMNIELLSEKEVAGLQSSINTAKSHINSLAYEKERMDEISDKISTIEAKNVQAMAAHEDAKAWKALEDELSPNGLPSELLGTVIDPLNQLLNESAGISGWGIVRIHPDMDITYNGRSYHLLSESERWRVDAMLAEVISRLSGYYFLMLDRADILSLAERKNLLNWCDALAASGTQVLLFATLKAKPEFEGIQSIWLEDGNIV